MIKYKIYKNVKAELIQTIIFNSPQELFMVNFHISRYVHQRIRNIYAIKSSATCDDLRVKDLQFGIYYFIPELHVNEFYLQIHLV